MSLGCAFLCHSHCALVFVQQKYAESSPEQEYNFCYKEVMVKKHGRMVRPLPLATIPLIRNLS